VDRTDFALLYSNYGTALGAAPLPVSAAELEAMSVFAAGVPEPSAAPVIAIAAAGAILRRSRRRA